MSRTQGGYLHDQQRGRRIELQLNPWFESLLKNPSGVRNLADFIAFNDENPDLEKPKAFESQSVCAYSRSNPFYFYIFFSHWHLIGNLCALRLTIWTRPCPRTYDDASKCDLAKFYATHKLSEGNSISDRWYCHLYKQYLVSWNFHEQRL